MKTRTLKKGFTAVEFAIIIGVVAVVLALAIPNIINTRIRANESAAVTNLQQLASAFEGYRVFYSEYPGAFSDLRNTQPALIDETLAAGQKQGYTFSFDNTQDTDYAFTVFASPTQAGISGVRSFKMGSSAQEASGVAYYAGSPSGPWLPIGYEKPGSLVGGGGGFPEDDPPDDGDDSLPSYFEDCVGVSCTVCDDFGCVPIGKDGSCQGHLCSACSGSGCVESIDDCIVGAACFPGGVSTADDEVAPPGGD